MTSSMGAAARGAAAGVALDAGGHGAFQSAIRVSHLHADGMGPAVFSVARPPGPPDGLIAGATQAQPVEVAAPA